MSDIKFAWETVDDEGYEVTIQFPGKYVVCSTCKGSGRAMMRSLRNEAFTREDFEEDPDFAEQYFNGGYDEECDTCHGDRVQLTLDSELAERTMPREVARYYEFEREMAELDAIEREERRNGA